MRCIICGPYLTEEMEMLLPEASPAAGKFLRNMEKGIKAAGCEVVIKSFQSIAIPDDSREKLNKLIADDTAEYVFKDGKLLNAIAAYRKMILQEIKEDDYVIFYNAVYPTIFMEQTVRRKKAHPILIMADYSEPQEYKSLPRKILAYLAKFDMGLYDKYAVLSNEFLKVISDRKPKLLLQGGIDDSIFDKFREPDYQSKILRFYYSGYLAEETGVKMLLDAFKKIENNNIELMVSGRGPLESLVNERAEYDQRIKYFGYVTNEEYYELLNRAHILVNPRDMRLPQNKNNFPSKMMEYLASGRMIISTKFAGWESFFDYVHFVESSVKALKEKIEECIKSNQVSTCVCFNKNRCFANLFSWENQCKRFQKFIKEDER